MDKILGINDRTVSALHALALAACSGSSISASAAAARLGLSPSYLSKILQSLAGKGIVSSCRGIGGGFSLGREAGGISCMEVLEALDGPLQSRYCLFEKPVCSSGSCSFVPLCRKIENEVRDALESTTIADIALQFSPEAGEREG